MRKKGYRIPLSGVSKTKENARRKQLKLWKNTLQKPEVISSTEKRVTKVLKATRYHAVNISVVAGAISGIKPVFKRQKRARNLMDERAKRKVK